jgi:hypothetical protein
MGVRLSALLVFLAVPPRKLPGTISVRGWLFRRAMVQLDGSGQFKISVTSVNRNRDLLTCSIVPRMLVYHNNVTEYRGNFGFRRQHDARLSSLRCLVIFLSLPINYFFYHPSLFTICTSTFSKLVEGSYSFCIVLLCYCISTQILCINRYLYLTCSISYGVCLYWIYGM